MYLFSVNQHRYQLNEPDLRVSLGVVRDIAINLFIIVFFYLYFTDTHLKLFYMLVPEYILEQIY